MITTTTSDGARRRRRWCWWCWWCWRCWCGVGGIVVVGIVVVVCIVVVVGVVVVAGGRSVMVARWSCDVVDDGRRRSLLLLLLLMGPSSAKHVRYGVVVGNGRCGGKKYLTKEQKETFRESIVTLPRCTDPSSTTHWYGTVRKLLSIDILYKPFDTEPPTPPSPPQLGDKSWIE